MPTATADPFTGAVTGSVTLLGERFGRAARRSVPASSTIAFRVAFGSLIALSTIRFLARGWVGDLYLTPDHHLTYPGLSWVVPLPGLLMYAHVIGLGVLGVAIAVGYRARLAAALFVVGFVYIELIDAALYLNHYWFVTLAGVLIAALPAPTPTAAGRRVPAITVWALRAQVAVVYVFAGLAKLNADWLIDAQPLGIWLAARTDRPVVGQWLDEPAVAHLFSWAGALFDLTIVGWLLWRRSRPFAYIAVVAFHLATATLFQIGVFPWLMIACTPIFFEPDWPDRLRCRISRRRQPERDSRDTLQIGRPTALLLAILAAMNVVLPLRHLAAEGDVAFNDDGYYLSWRVMLTERVGFVEFEVTDPRTGEQWTVAPRMVLTEWQSAQAVTRPDLALATAHLIAAEFASRGYDDVAVRADSWVAFNGRRRQRWIDPEVDLADVSRFAPAATYVLPREPAAR